MVVVGSPCASEEEKVPVKVMRTSDGSSGGNGGGAAVAEVVVDMSEGEGVRVCRLIDSDSSGYSVPRGKGC